MAQPGAGPDIQVIEEVRRRRDRPPRRERAANRRSAAAERAACGGGYRRAPVWARLCTVLGAVLMLTSGATLVSKEVLLARYESTVTEADLFGDADGVTAAPEPTSDITGPLNILLVGIDPRGSDPTWVPRADSVLVMHVPAGLDRAYLFSLPRDLWVRIPPLPKANYYGGRDKLAHAMYFGAEPAEDGARPNTARGFELLARAVSGHTGITRFDAGAIVNFTGFRRIVDAMGGVEMYIDQDVTSAHMRPDGRHRTPNGSGGEGPDGYLGPQKRYTKGTHHLSGWEALDYVRQRYIPGGDYARQRHQQQFIRAMVRQALTADLATDPVRMDAVLRAAGRALIFNGRGHSIVEYAIALRHLRPDSIVMVRLPGGGLSDEKGRYLGEVLDPVAEDFFRAVKRGTADRFLTAHPTLVNPVR